MRFHAIVTVTLTYHAIEHGRETALTLSPTSHVKGRTFDRFVQIWLENEQDNVTPTDPNFKWLASRGVILKDYHGVHHPSQPNYVTSVGGNRLAVLTDLPYFIPSEHKTIIDLLERRGVSWGLYQEDLPFTGFKGDYPNPETGKLDYVRKHNPLMSYHSVTEVPERMAKIKNFTLFYEDLAKKTLPQWMFITPNMTNNGHETSTVFGLAWAKNFLKPLLQHPTFMNNTLILLTWDEYEDEITDYLHDHHNVVSSLLLGDAISQKYHNTTQFANTKDGYSHCSILSTVELNWDLGDLDKGDKGAEPFW